MKKIYVILLLIIGASILSACDQGNTSQESALELGEVSNLHKATLQVEGMTCTSCALGIEYQLKNVEGVVAASVNYAKGTGFIIYNPGKVTAEEAAAASDVYPAYVIEDKPYTGGKKW